MYDESALDRSPNGDAASAGAELPDRCAYCGRPSAAGEDTLVLMRDGRPVAVYHERCHPNHRCSRCSAC